ncbi:MAG: hypothetical protein HN855_09770 [Anaerolineae bacterium]|jgi:hypothetical protein|nr:hypothetical protein [Anaerolineae bacterium]
MSNTRDSNFYYEIQDTLEKGLQEHGYEISLEVIKGIFSDLFDRVAIHVWSRPDVYRVAWEAGWPISQDMANEILSDVEGHVDSEYGITWLTFENAVQEFYEDFNWGILHEKDYPNCIGDFLIERHYPSEMKDPPLETSLHLSSVSLADALNAASEMAEIRGLAISVYSIPKDKSPSLDDEWLEQYAHKLWSFKAEED